MEGKGHLGRALNHMSLAGWPSLVAGLVLLVYVPQLKPVAAVLVWSVGFRLVGLIVVVASLYAMVGKGPHRRSTAPAALDFGWAPAMTVGPWTAALATAAGAVAVQMAIPAWWPVSLLLAFLATGFFAGYLLTDSFRQPDNAALPLVACLSGDPDQVLDAGCGAGRATVAVGQVLKKGSVVAVDRFDAGYIQNGGRDLLERNLQIAGLTERVRIVEGDLTRLPFPDQTFDSAVSTHAVDHLGPDKEQGLREIRRVLKPGGRFLLVVTVPNWATVAVANVMSFFVIFTTGKGGWKRMASRAGFTVMDSGNFNGTWYLLLERPAA